MLVDHLIAGTPAYLTAALTMILQNHSTRICTCIIHYSVIYGKKNWITGHVPYSRGIMIMACFLYAHIVTWSSSIFCAQPWETTHRSEIHACVQQAGIVHKTGKTISLKITCRICIITEGVSIPLFTVTFNTKYKAKLIHQYQYWINQNAVFSLITPIPWAYLSLKLTKNSFCVNDET